MNAISRKVVAFCPWIKFRAKPFDMCGVRVMGFHDAQALLGAPEREALWRAPAPYGSPFLNVDRTPRPWNDNPLLYAFDPENPLREPTDEQVALVRLANALLYLCVFSSNEVRPGGLQMYTNAADWALYFHPVQNPTHFALGERRLYGTLQGGGYLWDRTLISQPIEGNRCELYARRLDEGLIKGVTALNAQRRALMYLAPVRTFMLGTSDNHLWRREDDLPFLWAAIEQVMESDGLRSCVLAQRDLERSSQALRLSPQHSTSLVRSVVGSAPRPEYMWNADFRPR